MTPDLALVRVSTLTHDDPLVRLAPPTTDECGAWLALVRSRDDVLEAIADAAPALVDALARFERLSPRRRAKVTRSVWRYVNRMAFRPTPCGRLSRIGMLAFGDGPVLCLRQEALTHDEPAVDPDHPVDVEGPLVTSPWIELGPDGVAWLPRPGQQRDLDSHLVRLDTTRVIGDVMDAAAVPRTRAELHDLLEREHPSVGTARVTEVLTRLERMHVLVPAAPSPKSVPVPHDRSVVTEVNLAPRRLQAAAACLVDALDRATLPEPYPDQLRDYATAFERRYGRGAEVGILEVTSSLRGLGVSAPVPPRPLDACSPELAPMLGELLHRAQAGGEWYVEPSDDWLSRMRSLREESLDERPQRAAVDVTFSERAMAPWVGGLEPGYVLERTGTNRAGQMGARFLRHFSPDLVERYSRQTRSASAPEGAPLPVTLDYDLAPANSRYQQLVRGPGEDDVVLSLRPGPKRTSAAIGIDEVVIGVDENGVLRLRSRTDGRHLDVSHRSMVRYGLAPHLARMLMEVSEHQFRRAGDFFLGPLARFPFFPGVHVGPHLLSRPRWYIDRARVASRADLRAWVGTVGVPRVVAARVMRSDQFLVLDLATDGGLDEAWSLLEEGTSGLVLEHEVVDPAGPSCEVVVTTRQPTEAGQTGASVAVRPAAPPARPIAVVAAPPTVVIDLELPGRSVDALLRHDYQELLDAVPPAGEGWWTRRHGPDAGLRVHVPEPGRSEALRVIEGWRARLRVASYATVGSAAPDASHGARVASARVALAHVRRTGGLQRPQWLASCLGELRSAAMGMLDDQDLREHVAQRVRALPPGLGGTLYRELRHELDGAWAATHGRDPGLHPLDTHAAALGARLGTGSTEHHRAVARLLGEHANRLGLRPAEEDLLMTVWDRWARSEAARVPATEGAR